MSRKPKNPVGASVIAQARRLADANAESQPLAKVQHLLHSRLDDTPDPETGAPRLRVIVPTGQQPNIFDFSRLLSHPQLAELLAEGFGCWGKGVGERSLWSTARNLNSGFGDFLLTREHPIDPATIDESFWTAFLRWLNAPRGRHGEPWALETRIRMNSAVSVCLEALIGHPQHGATATYLLDRSGFPRNAWPGAAKKREPAKTLLPSEMEQIVTAALAEITVIQMRLAAREDILAVGRERLEDARTRGLAIPYDDLGVCCALIEDLFPDRLAFMNDLRAADRQLACMVGSKHRMSKVREILYSSFRDLVPFVVLLAIRTAYNPDTVLGLCWSGIQSVLDGKKIRISGPKGRATQAQSELHEAHDGYDKAEPLDAELGVAGGLADMLDTLRNLNAQERKIVPNRDHQDRLFISAPTRSGIAVRGFDLGTGAGPASDMCWQNALAAFIQQHHLSAFTLKTFRATEAERVYFETGDPLEVKRRLQHRSARTTWTHYTSDRVRRHGQDRIAETQDLLVRWIDTDGQVESRGRMNWEIAATTPGFLCLDPYDSPRPGQRQGRLCTAYGECPSCQMAAAKPGDPKAVASYQALRRAIYVAQQGQVSGAAWIVKWAPILTDLDRLLAEVPADVASDASKYRITLKPVG